MRTPILIILLLSAACKSEQERKPLLDISEPSASLEENSQDAPAFLTGDKSKSVRICIDSAETYPFSFMEGREFKGVHVDIARDAITAAGFGVTFKYLPWKRCIEHEMKNGTADAALSAAWSESREEYLWYPENARELGPKCKSPEALICNGPVLLVPSTSRFEYTGDPKSIPEPIRVTFGYTQADAFKNLGKKVDEGPGDEFNVGKMARDGTGSVLIWKLNLQHIEGSPKLKSTFRVVEGYEDLSDGFLPFSKTGQLSHDDAKKIWTELRRLHASEKYFEGILARYPPMSSTKP